MNTRKYLDKLNGNLNIVGKNIENRRNKIKLILFGIDVSSQSIFDIEKGTRTVIDYELCAIAKVLGTTSDELMGDFKHYLDQFN